MKEDKNFTAICGKLLLGVKDLVDWGVEGGHTTMNNLRLTVTARQHAVKQLTGKGLSERAVAKTLGVGRDTVRNDLGRKAPKNGAKGATKSNVDNINALARDAVDFTQRYVERVETFLESTSKLDRDAKLALLQAFNSCAEQFEELAKHIEEEGK